MELPDMLALAAELGGKAGEPQESAYPQALANLSAQECRALGERYIEQTRIQRKTGKPFFLMIDCGVVLGTLDASTKIAAVVADIVAITGGHVDL